MLFDKIAGIVERNLLDFVPIFNESKVFKIEMDKEALEKEFKFSDEGWARFKKEFILPFDFSALDYGHTFLLMGDSQHEQVGLMNERMFLIGTASSSAPWFSPNEFIIAYGSFNMKVFKKIKSLGEKSSKVKIAERFHEDWIQEAFIGTKKKLIPLKSRIKKAKSSKEGWSSFQDAMFWEIYQALVIVWYFNSPDYFILEEKPLKRMSSTSKKILRSPKRPVFTMLKPKVIRERMGLPPPKGTHKSPIPHERRRHYRELRSPKFKHKQGQRIVIQAVWVGPKESVVGNKKYKVRIDL